jgi:hypothetical protein
MRLIALAAGFAWWILAFSFSPAKAVTTIVVDVTGTDNGTCGVPASPCKTLQGGVDRAATGDTVFLDLAGDYGPATVDKTITIQAVKGAGVFSPPSMPCVTINGGASTSVTILELTCDQGGAAEHGILFQAGNFLELRSVTIRAGSGGACGLYVQSTTSASTFWVNYSSITKFLGTNGGAVCAVPAANNHAEGYLNFVAMEDNENGIRASGTQSGSSVDIFMTSSSAALNNTGVNATGPLSAVFVTNSKIVSNAVGLKHSAGAQITSYGQNSVAGNGSNGTFTNTLGTE